MTKSASQPLATSTDAITRRKIAVWANAPVVMAMLTNNNLSNCRDVTSMLQECNRTSSKDQVCLAAMKRMESCALKGRMH
mmetsp:Transcript_19363/g.44891  ORF Transcript_19363/g.44891 Transcript_19363/m.44891 type:complete len:80 (+) Transcript_19363:102-341(+)